MWVTVPGAPTSRWSGGLCHTFVAAGFRAAIPGMGRQAPVRPGRPRRLSDEGAANSPRIAAEFDAIAIRRPSDGEVRTHETRCWIDRCQHGQVRT